MYLLVLMWIIVFWFLTWMCPFLVLPMLFFTAMFLSGLAVASSRISPQQKRRYERLRNGFWWAAGLIWGGHGFVMICRSFVNDNLDNSLVFPLAMLSGSLAVVGFYFDCKSSKPIGLPPADQGYRPIVQPGMLFFLAALFFAASALVVVALFADDKPGLYVICCAAGGVIGTILLALPGLYIQSKMLSVGRQRSLTSRPSSHER